MRVRLQSWLLVVGLFFLNTTLAQPNNDSACDWTFAVAGGLLYTPSYAGSDDYQLSALPSLRADYCRRFSASVENGIWYDIMHAHSDWSIGPIARIQFSRDEDGDSPFRIAGDSTTDLLGMGDIDTGLETGLFTAYDFGAAEMRLELRQGLGGHEALVGDLEVTFSGRWQTDTAPGRWQFGPRFRFGDQDYLAAYFGVTPAQSLGSGLPVYTPSSGLVSAGLRTTWMQPLTKNTAIIGLLAINWLQGDAKDSPLVRLRGDDQQISAGVFYSYRFE